MTALVTFDFHNTLAVCDAWFALEIRDLPVRVLETLMPAAMAKHGRDAVTRHYRRLRQDVMAHGREVDAVKGVQHVARAIGLDLPDEAVAGVIEGLMREALVSTTPVPGAVESIRGIRDAGVMVGIVSSAVYHPFLEWTLASFGVADDVSFVLTSASSGFYKSNPEIYRVAMRQAGADASRSFHVGDSARWDVWSATEAGMRTVLYTNGNSETWRNEAPQANPTHVVTSMGDVAPWVLMQLEDAR